MKKKQNKTKPLRCRVCYTLSPSLPNEKDYQEILKHFTKVRKMCPRIKNEISKEWDYG